MNIPCRKVFVSSTTKDLWEYRKAAYDVVSGLSKEYLGKFQLVPVTMDTEGQSGERVAAIDECINWVEESHWIVLIVAWNYGHVGQDGRSVTECEYRYATDICKPPKKCFVYMAGDLEDIEKAYTSDKETQNLATWKERDKVSETDWKRLIAFRKHLRDGRRFDLFANIQDFKELLRNSLKRRIDRELQPQPRDPVFLTLLLKLKGKVVPCIQTINLLANLKRMHDCLHKIRQLGVRRWREEVLTQWREGPLTMASAALIYQPFVNGLVEVSKHMGGLSALRPLVSAEVPKVKEKIEKVLEIDFSDATIKALSTRDEFEKAVNLYAGRVESAFSTANRQMQERARELQKHNDDLQSGLSLARKQQGLTEEQDRRVGEEIELVRDRFEGLQIALARHDEWQRWHETLERMDTSKATQLFEDELERFLDRLEDVFDLLANLRSSIEMSEKSDEWSRKIDLVQNHSKRLKEEPGEMAYDAMRKAFDDVFFDVDIATLSKVEAAERRVTDLDRALKDFEGKVLREKGPVVGVTL